MYTFRKDRKLELDSLHPDPSGEVAENFRSFHSSSGNSMLFCLRSVVCFAKFILSVCFERLVFSTSKYAMTDRHCTIANCTIVSLEFRISNSVTNV